LENNLCSLSPNENQSSQNSKNPSSNTGRKIKPLKNQSNLDRLRIRIDFTMVLRLSRGLRITGHFFLQLLKTSYHDTRLCSENASSVSGDGIVMDCLSSKKCRKRCDSNQTKKLRSQRVESRDLLMNVIITHETLHLSGDGISIISVDGSIWTTRTARWIRTIWNQ